MTRSDERWKEISEIVDAALNRPDHERLAFIAVACGNNEELRREIESLLASNSDTNAILATPAADVMAEAMGVLAQRIATDARSLIGRRIGHYLIDARLGAGGMGEVYKATDTRLRRPVALKLLPKYLRDARSQRRFDREAQAIAAVRHPHICVVHDIGQDGDIEYLVMEYLEGETLAQRLTRGPLPFDEATTLAIEIADALEATHRQRITHRDLKPGNVMLTTSGAKLLDFGLATLHSTMAPDPAAEQTESSTTSAAIAGTPAYMAPEQMLGKESDHRSDIFAFGTLLYETVTGRKPFNGENRSELAAAILNSEPAPMASDVPRASRGLEALIRRCLAKDPNARWQSAADLGNELRQVAGRPADVRPPRREPRSRRRLVMVTVVAFALLTGAARWRTQLTDVLFSRLDEVPPSGLILESPLQLQNERPLTGKEEFEVDPALSPPRGKFVAFSAGTALGVRIFIREIDGSESRPLTANSDEYQFQPRWSSDGKRVLYLTRDGAFVAPATGSDMPRRLASNNGVADHSQNPNAAVRITGAAWSPDGNDVAIARGTSIEIVPINGIRGRRLTTVASDVLHHCDWSPDRKWIACVSGNWNFAEPRADYGNIAPSEIVLIPTSGGSLVEITTGHKHQNLNPVWSADSSQLYFASTRMGKSNIYMVDISANGHALGDPRQVTSAAAIQSFAFSADRTRLVYTEYTARSNLWSLPIPTDVSTGPVGVSGANQLTSGVQVIESVSVSPDKQWLLYDSNLRGNSDIFRIPIDGGKSYQLTSDERDDFAPVVSPDNLLLAYHSFRGGPTRDIFVQPLIGGPPVPVAATQRQESYPIWLSRNRLTFFAESALNDAPSARFIVERDKLGKWGKPRLISLPDGAWRLKVLPDGRYVYIRGRGVEINTPDLHSPRWLYSPDSTRPPPEKIDLAHGESDSVYIKAHDDQGHASIWRLPISGGSPVHLVQFDDLSRPSIRLDFAVGRGQLFFTIDEHRSRIWVAELSKR